MSRAIAISKGANSLGGFVWISSQKVIESFIANGLQEPLAIGRTMSIEVTVTCRLFDLHVRAGEFFQSCKTKRSILN
jgi:hypothetical protein